MFLIKAHGDCNPKDQQRLSMVDPTTDDQTTLNEMRIVENNGVLLVRNPFNVIYSFRHYVKKDISVLCTPKSPCHGDEHNFSGIGKVCFCIIHSLTFLISTTVMLQFC